MRQGRLRVRHLVQEDEEAEDEVDDVVPLAEVQRRLERQAREHRPRRHRAPPSALQRAGHPLPSPLPLFKDSERSAPSPKALPRLSSRAPRPSHAQHAAHRRAEAMSTGKRIALFDVDGTLTKPRGKATEEMLAFMQQLRKVRVGRRASG